LAILFWEDRQQKLQEGINRLSKQGLLEGVAQGIYCLFVIGQRVARKACSSDVY